MLEGNGGTYIQRIDDADLISPNILTRKINQLKL